MKCSESKQIKPIKYYLSRKKVIKIQHLFRRQLIVQGEIKMKMRVSFLFRIKERGRNYIGSDVLLLPNYMRK